MVSPARILADFALAGAIEAPEQRDVVPSLTRIIANLGEVCDWGDDIGGSKRRIRHLTTWQLLRKTRAGNCG